MPMSSKLPRILFLQLPRLDNERSGPRENPPMSGFYLLHALEKEKNTRPEVRFLTRQEEDLDDKHLSDLIIGWKPDVIAATLYLWNIERTLHLLRKARRRLPYLKSIAGGPEVAYRHPFLFKSHVFDVAVMGEGEIVLAQILKALGNRFSTNFDQVAWKKGNSYEWGNRHVPSIPIHLSLPGADHPRWQPDQEGMAYLETGRGCPLSCTYCRYGHLRRETTFLAADEVAERVRILMDRGATEIRFIDPVFNANPEFHKVLKAIRKINRSRKITFFAEVRADSLNRDEVHL